MTKKNNTNKEFFRFVLDTETTDLGINLPPVRRLAGTNLQVLMSEEQLRNSFRHLDITQIAYKIDNMPAQHLSVAVNSRWNISNDSVIRGSERNTSVKVGNTVISTKAKLVKYSTPENAASTIMAGKGTDAFKKAMVSRAKEKVEALHEVITPDNRRLILSKTSLGMLAEQGELGRASDILNGRTKLAKNLTKAHNVIYNATNQVGFEGKGGESLYRLIEDLYLNNARAGKTVVHQGQNAMFDFERMRGMLVKFGHMDMLAEIDRAYYSGMIQVQGLEELWQAITYKLAQENPEMMKNFLIHLNPDAIANTGRPGRIPTNFKEWRYAAPWDANTEGKLLSYSKGVRSAMPEGYEIHAAGADTNLERATYNELKAIYKAYLKEAGIQGTGSIDEFVKFNSKDTQLLTNILDARIRKSTANIVGEDVVKSVNEFKELFVNTALKKNKYIRERGLNIIGENLAKSTNNKLLKYGGIATAISAILYTTYGFTKEGEYDPSNAKLRHKTMFGKKQPFSDFKAQFEHDPSKTYGTLSLLGYGISAPILGLYGAGLMQAMNRPKLLGRKVAMPLSPREGVNEFFKTVRWGAKFMESSIPMTKVFRTSSMLNMMMGRSNLVYDESSESFTRSIKMTTWENGYAKNVWENKELGAGRKPEGVLFDELLAKAEKTLPKSRYEQLASFFKPETENLHRDTVKTIVQIANTKNGSMVLFKELNDRGNPVEANRFQQVRLSFKVQDWQNKETDIKNIDAAYRRAKIRKVMTDPMVHGRLEEDLYKFGHSPQYTLEQYLQNMGIAKQDQSKATLKNIWNKAKYYLELDKKGVGEYGNAFFKDMSFYTRKINTIVTPKDASRFRGLLSEFTVKGMNTFLESPLELTGIGPERMMQISKELRGSRYMAGRLLGTAAKYISRSHLGLINYTTSNMGTPRYLAKFATKRLLPAWLAYEAFSVTDHVLGALTFSKGAGPITTSAIKAWQWSTLIYSKLSDITGATRMAKRQEKVAPGSTGLGIFVPSLTAVSIYKTGELLYRFGSGNFKKSINNIAGRFKQNSFVKKALAPEAFKGAINKTPLERYFNWAIKNPKQAIFSFMMLPMLPFVPGFLGSNKSYKERKAEYDGRKEVPIRKYRGWLLSSSAYQGGRPTQFRRHLSNLISSDWENKGVIWPSYFKRAAHNLSLGLIGRYELEEYHAKDQPVYQSAPWGANIPLIGPALSMTIGRFIKPTRTYHSVEEGDAGSGISPFSHHGGFLVGDHNKLSDKDLIRAIGVTPEGSNSRLYHRMSDQFRDLIGFRGFMYETIKGSLAGKKNADEFTPYAQDATEMYNPANSMWQYQLGDVTAVGGEFLRRLFVFPEKIWRVNNIQNELAGVSWIPQKDETNEFKKFGKDLTHGTTFDKVQMGWLYGSRKGWEFLYPEVKGADLENYPDPIRIEILKQLAPYSNEFNKVAQDVMNMAVDNGLTPYQEQRYYETLDQVRQMKDQVYAHDNEYSYKVSTHKQRGIVTNVDEFGNFTIGDHPQTQYKLAGVSLRPEDIRFNLLQQNRYNSAEEIDEDVKKVQAKTSEIINKHLYNNASVNMEVADFDQMVDTRHGVEAVVGDLNDELIAAGAARADTGNIAKYNMQQDQMGMGSRSMAKYWDAIIPAESFWATKLIPKRDYIENYLYNQVFNREVKLWSKPIEHILKPFIATEFHRLFGIDIIPSFTTQRRKDQEYWDVIKYIKYKMLSAKASQDGDEGQAQYYHNLWRTTMLGADPTDDNIRDELAALPTSERAYFNRFSEEPDPKKRGKIYKYLPVPAKRIYSAIWAKKEAEAGDNKEVLERFERLKEAEGWDVSDEEIKQYEKDTGGRISLADYVRGKYISEFAKDNPIPDASWLGWSEDIDIEDVELLSLKEGGRNIQDYGFFDNKARVAAYNGPAVTASIDINSIHSTSSQAIGMIMPYMMSSDHLRMSHGMPTASNNPISTNIVETPQHEEQVKRHNFMALAAVDDALNLLVKAL